MRLGYAPESKSTRTVNRVCGRASELAVPKSVSAAEAGRLYDEHSAGSWRMDSIPGICLAVQAELADELAYAIELERRRRMGLRAEADRKVPPWVLGALPDCAEMAQAMPAPSGLLGALLQAPLLLSLVMLCRTGSVAGLYRHAGDAERESLERIAAQLGHRPPAQHAALHMFYFGTRAHFHLLGRGEPTPGEVRLLAAARELDPITEGLDAARKRWEDRIRRWRKEPGFTELVNQAARCGTRADSI